jgi:hypothetical protein
VVFFEDPLRGGYESDNHTVGYFTTQGGTVIPTVPEPSSWAMLALGVVGMGAVRLRRRG